MGTAEAVVAVAVVTGREPVRPSVDIPLLRARLAELAVRLTDLEGKTDALSGTIEYLQNTVDQLMGVFECGQIPAPVFLRWDYTKRHSESRQEARTEFGRYRLEVIDWPSAVYWEITRGSKMVAVGGHPCSFSSAMDEAESELRLIIQENSLKRGGGT